MLWCTHSCKLMTMTIVAMTLAGDTRAYYVYRYAHAEWHHAFLTPHHKCLYQESDGPSHDARAVSSASRLMNFSCHVD